MALFTAIEGANAILRQKGVFKQAPIYQRGNDLFAKHGGGFVGLRRDYATTHPDVRWDEIDGVGYVSTHPLGMLQVSPAEPRVRRAA